MTEELILRLNAEADKQDEESRAMLAGFVLDEYSGSEVGSLLREAAEALAGREAYPIGSDREVLLYLMQQFDGETWECERCGHSEETATMDSADYLRRYLATTPSRAGGGEVGAVSDLIAAVAAYFPKWASGEVEPYSDDGKRIVDALARCKKEGA